MNDHQRPNFLQEFEDEQTPKKRPRSVFFLLLFVAFIIGFFGVRTIGKALFIPDSISYDPVTLEPIQPDGILNKLKYLVFNDEDTLVGAKEDRINVLVMGQGGPGHDGPYLTDTIILVSIKPSTGQIAFVSIPRDLYVAIPGNGYNKINHANAFGENDRVGGGLALAKETVESTFDVDISYVIRVDFAAFAEIVDAVGGITVDVDTPFVDYEYPAANYEYQTVQFNAGIQTFNGDQALKFVRSRHGSNGEGSDFARSKRQQKVILALKEKLLSFDTISNPVSINNILNSVQEHVLTNMAFSDMVSLLRLSKELEMNEIISLTLDSSPEGYLKNGYTQGGAFILMPTSGSFTDINQKIDTIFDQEALATTDDTPKQLDPGFPAANIEVQNGTWSAGLAARVQKQLVDANFTVPAIGNTTERPLPSSHIIVVNDSVPEEAITSLQERLDIPVLYALPEMFTVDNSTDLLVVLGTDFTL